MSFFPQGAIRPVLIIDLLFGLGMLAPVLLPGNPFDINNGARVMIMILMIFTVSMIWLARFRHIKDAGILLPLLISVAGQVVALFFLVGMVTSVILPPGGIALLTILFVVIVPYINAGMRIRTINRLMNQPVPK